MDSDEPFYMRRMEEISITEEPYFDVDCSHLKSFDAELYRQLICYPQVMVLRAFLESCV